MAEGCIGGCIGSAWPIKARLDGFGCRGACDPLADSPVQLTGDLLHHFWHVDVHLHWSKVKRTGSVFGDRITFFGKISEIQTYQEHSCKC